MADAMISRRAQQGQSLVLACLLILVLSLSVLTILHVGHRVNERIRLQNTADAAAYSMAVMEARAFNFYALANRAQASHYVSAMVWQSYLSFIYFSEAFLTDLYGMFKSLDHCAGNRSVFWSVACPILERVPYLGAILTILNRVLGAYRVFLTSYQRFLRSVNPDFVIGRIIIPAHRQLNQALAGASEAMMLTALGQVIGTADRVVQENDRNLSMSAARTLSATVSACLFDRAHFREAGGSPLAPINPLIAIDPRAIHERSKQSRAKRVMAGIANATRATCNPNSQSCPHFVTSRKLGELLPVPEFLGGLRGLIDQITPKWGQTRLLSYSLAKGFEDAEGGNLIRHWRDPPDAPEGMMAQGDNLGADDIYSIGLGPASLGPFHNPFACNADSNYWECWGDPRMGRGNDLSLPFRHMLKTSVWALNSFERRGGSGGVHWRVSYPGWPHGAGQVDPTGEEAAIGLHETETCVIRGICLPGMDIAVFTANVRAIEDGNHSWGGIVPFFHFEPGQYADRCPTRGTPALGEPAERQQEFNQPSTWIALNKSPAQLRNPIRDQTGAANISPALLNSQARIRLHALGTAEISLDGSHSQFRLLGGGSGLNVISRGQVYYHRPGNWAEQPNFFNPYWRARLAPVYQGRRDLAGAEGLLDALPDSLSARAQQFITH
jgi:hypothetical protein